MKWLLSNIFFILAEILYPKFLINNLRSISLIKNSLKKFRYHFHTSNDQKCFFYGRTNFYQILFQLPLILGIKLKKYQLYVILPEPKLWIIFLYRKFGAKKILTFNNIFFKIQHPETINYFNKLISTKKLVYRNIDFYNLLYSTELRKIKRGRLCFQSIDKKYLKKQISYLLHIIDRAFNLLEIHKPNKFFFEDRGYYPEGIFYEISIKKNIDVIEFHAGHRRGLQNFKRYNKKNKRIHPIAISKKDLNFIKNKISLNEATNYVFSELKKCYSDGSWYDEVGTSKNKRSFTKSQFLNKFKLDKKKKICVLFNHILWDATFFWGDDIFADYQDWLIQSVNFIKKQKDVNWIIKCHPANVVKNFRDKSNTFMEEEILKKEFPNLPDHIKIINSKSNLSTFSLLQFIDCCVTVRGTIGIEAACFGIPVITAGTGRYEKFGFTINSRNTKQYFENLSMVKSLSRINNTNAIYYAYAILFSKQLPIKKVNISFDKTKFSNLKVELNSYDTEISSDIKQISSWLSSKKEDLLVNK